MRIASNSAVCPSHSTLTCSRFGHASPRSSTPFPSPSSSSSESEWDAACSPRNTFSVPAPMPCQLGRGPHTDSRSRRGNALKIAVQSSTASGNTLFTLSAVTLLRPSTPTSSRTEPRTQHVATVTAPGILQSGVRSVRTLMDRTPPPHIWQHEHTLTAVAVDRGSRVLAGRGGRMPESASATEGSGARGSSLAEISRRRTDARTWICARNREVQVDPFSDTTSVSRCGKDRSGRRGSGSRCVQSSEKRSSVSLRYNVSSRLHRASVSRNLSVVRVWEHLVRDSVRRSVYSAVSRGANMPVSVRLRRCGQCRRVSSSLSPDE